MVIKLGMGVLAVHEFEETLRGLLDREKENDVDEESAVGADQVKCLQAWSNTISFALWVALHRMHQYVAPYIDDQHGWRDPDWYEKAQKEGISSCFRLK